MINFPLLLNDDTKFIKKLAIELDTTTEDLEQHFQEIVIYRLWVTSTNSPYQLSNFKKLYLYRKYFTQS